MALSGPEITAIVHGLLGTVFLMAFAGSYAELIQLTHAGMKRVKWGITIMAGTAIIIDLLGDLIYTVYRAPVPDSARSLIKAGSTPWVHEIGMELKEHVAHFVPVLMLIALFMVVYYKEDLVKSKELRAITAGLLVTAMLVTLVAFGLGAYITKVQPIK
ncbi:hypothetical protein J4475_04405 [Candidatus Woesearchaeota archaeon]|nr:hypothetical protein [Candidatus Woesearchaeota archaeon]